VCASKYPLEPSDIILSNQIREFELVIWEGVVESLRRFAERFSAFSSFFWTEGATCNDILGIERNQCVKVMPVPGVNPFPDNIFG
jgi:hypothetical protein